MDLVAHWVRRPSGRLRFGERPDAERLMATCYSDTSKWPLKRRCRRTDQGTHAAAVSSACRPVWRWPQGSSAATERSQRSGDAGAGHHGAAIIGSLGGVFLLSLVFVQWLETIRRAEEAGLRPERIVAPASSVECIECHQEANPGIIEHWRGSTHAEKGVGCVECHRALAEDPDSHNHYGFQIATVVTPRDCAACHPHEAEEFARSHHAAGGNILASLDNFLAETVEGSTQPFNPHSPTPGRPLEPVNGLASAFLGCQQCHGSKVGLRATDGGTITLDDLRPDENGIPTNADVLDRILRNDDGRPLLDPGTWPNTGIGRLNLDGSRGSCSACHKQYDDFVTLYNEKFAKPGQAIMAALLDEGLRSPTQFDEEIEWTWFYLWHHEGRRARHGASMMAPDYTHWHGMFEVAERFYMELIPQALEMTDHAASTGRVRQARAVRQVVDSILSRPEHSWFQAGAEAESSRIRAAMAERYGPSSTGPPE